jgi:general secretion pathway protein E
VSANVGNYLIDKGLLQPGQLEQALHVNQGSEEKLGQLLVQLGFVSERDLASSLAEMLGLDLAESEQYQNALDISDRVNKEFLIRNRVLGLDESDQVLTVAMADPGDTYLLDALKLSTGKQIHPFVGTAADIQAALEQLFENDEALAEVSAPAVSAVEGNLDDIEQLKDMASEAPVVRAVNQVLVRALDMRASDIHIEPHEHGLKVRYRIDGVLRNMPPPSTVSPAAVVSRVKVMANLNIAERRLPQDGRIKIRVEGREVDMRISTIPTLYGESVVIRLLDQRGVPLDFESLGFDGSNLDHLRELLKHPQGIILVTGPTGSGKTTTLYAALRQLNTPEKKILTVEDPVEYQLEGVNQIQVQPKIDLTFANALRSILRQDPDIIMIGEMRDTETAKIAVQAALTGHKVLSTLHTNDAPSSITRMLDMHVDDFLLTSTIDGVLAQRLVRRLCPECRESYTPPEETKTKYQLNDLAGNAPEPLLYRAVGCEHCDHSGYRGRSTISEVLVMSEPLRQAINQRATADDIREIAIREGMVTMHEDGLGKALRGITTLDEIERVTQASQVVG